MTRAAIYARISQDRQGAGLGVRRQQDDCEEHARRLGWTVAAVHTDNDLSAYSGKPRPGYQQLLDQVTDGQVDAIVAWHPDRLHRSPRELEDFIDLVEQTGVRVATVTAGDVDLSTPEGRLAARIVGSVARKESEDKSRRLRRKHLEIARNGGVPGGGNRPFGFEADRRTVRPGEAQLIREAARRVLAGESLWSIRADWTDRGVATSTGAGWSTTAIKTLLCGARVAGKREHRGKLYDAAWEPIVDEVTWRRVRAVLNDPARALARPARRYLLTGIAVCGECGERLHAAPRSNGRRAYACLKTKGGCGGVSILADPLEGHVGAMVAAAVDGRQVAARQPDDPGDDEAVAAQRDAEARLAELDQWYAEGRLGLADWQRLRDLVEQRHADAERRLAERPAALDALPADWREMDWPQRRAAIEALLERVAVHRAFGPRSRFNPDRIGDPVWRV